MHLIRKSTFNSSLITLLIFLSVFSTSAKAAEELTKEGAQAFIAEVASRGNLYWGPFSPRGNLNEYMYGYDRRGREDWIRFDLGRIKNAKALSPCDTAFDFEVDKSESYNTPNLGVPATNPLAERYDSVLKINWTKTTSFKLREFDQLIAGSIPSYPDYPNTFIAFRLGDESLRKRLVFAFEFLRLNCDTLSKSGF